MYFSWKRGGISIVTPKWSRSIYTSVIAQEVRTKQFTGVKTDIVKSCVTILSMVYPTPSQIVNNKVIFYKN